MEGRRRGNGGLPDGRGGPPMCHFGTLFSHRLQCQSAIATLEYPVIQGYDQTAPEVPVAVLPGRSHPPRHQSESPCPLWFSVNRHIRGTLHRLLP
jgi:hypothetical protein